MRSDRLISGGAAGRDKKEPGILVWADGVGGLRAEVPGGRGRSYRAGMAGTAGQSGPTPPSPSSHCLTGPCQGQGKAQNREPHGVQGQAGAELAAGGARQRRLLKPSSLPRASTSALLAPRCWLKPCPCFLGLDNLLPPRELWNRRDTSTCSPRPSITWKHSQWPEASRSRAWSLPTGPELVSRGERGSGGRNRMVEEPLTSTHQAPDTLTPHKAMYPQDPMHPQIPAVGFGFLSPRTLLEPKMPISQLPATF